MKDQFQATESLHVRFPPFINMTTGEEIIGTDTCLVTYKKPGSAPASLSASWDTDIELWTLDIAPGGGNYAQGEWLFKAVSNDVNALPQRKVLQWGDYVNDLDALISSRSTPAQILSDATPMAGANVNALTPTRSGYLDAAISSRASGTDYTSLRAARLDNLDDLVSSRLASDDYTSPDNTNIGVAAAQATAAAVDAAVIKKVQIGRWKIDGTQLVLYEIDGLTEYKRFDLKDNTGAPSATRIFERVPA